MNLDRALELFQYRDTERLELGTLKKDYRELAKKYHPDKEGGSDQEFSLLNEAYSYLKIFIEEKEKLIEDKPDFYTSFYTPKKKKKDKSTKIDEATKIIKDIAKFDSASGSTLELHSSVVKHQRILIQKTEEVVTDLVREYSAQKNEMEEELEEIIVNIKKKYKKRRILGIFPVSRNNGEKDYSERYAELMTKYNQVRAELDADFYAKALKLYGESLNAINDTLAKID